MLDPDVVLAAVVAAFRDIPEVVTEMGDVANITGHYFACGTENSLAAAIYQMTSPSILVTYLDLLGGNFDGMTLWKHRLEAYIRPGNGQTGYSSVPHVGWLMVNKHLATIAPGLNIRQVSLLSGALQPMDTPTLLHKLDENGADYFCWQMVFAEHGDQ